MSIFNTSKTLSSKRSRKVPQLSNRSCLTARRMNGAVSLTWQMNVFRITWKMLAESLRLKFIAATCIIRVLMLHSKESISPIDSSWVIAQYTRSSEQLIQYWTLVIKLSWINLNYPNLLKKPILITVSALNLKWKEWTIWGKNIKVMAVLGIPWT